MIFPAQFRERRVAKPQAVMVSEDSTCFFHTENQAEAICDGCGRFLCTVCAIPLAQARFCPACMAGQKKQAVTLIPQRILYDGGALSLVLLSLLIWPISFLTAPIVFGLVIYGWNKPCSFVHGRRRWKQVIAGLFSLGQMGAWSYVGVQLWLR